MKKTRRFLATLLTMVMLVSMGTTAFAAEAQPKQPAVAENTMAAVDVAVPEVADEEGIMPLAASGYAAGYTNNNTGSYIISVSGSSLWSSVKLKAWSFSSPADVYVSLYRPDGSAAFTDLKLPLEQLVTKTVYNVQPGDWRLSYYIAGDGRGWTNCEF